MFTEPTTKDAFNTLQPTHGRGTGMSSPMMGDGHPASRQQFADKAWLARDPNGRLSSHQLLAGGVEVEIQHGLSVYRLRQTLAGKLILTK